MFVVTEMILLPKFHGPVRHPAPQLRTRDPGEAGRRDDVQDLQSSGTSYCSQEVEVRLKVGDLSPDGTSRQNSDGELTAVDGG